MLIQRIGLNLQQNKPPKAMQKHGESGMPALKKPHASAPSFGGKILLSGEECLKIAEIANNYSNAKAAMQAIKEIPNTKEAAKAFYELYGKFLAFAKAKFQYYYNSGINTTAKAARFGENWTTHRLNNLEIYHTRASQGNPDVIRQIGELGPFPLARIHDLTDPLDFVITHFPKNSDGMITRISGHRGTDFNGNYILAEHLDGTVLKPLIKRLKTLQTSLFDSVSDTHITPLQTNYDLPEAHGIKTLASSMLRYDGNTIGLK